MMKEVYAIAIRPGAPPPKPEYDRWVARVVATGAMAEFELRSRIKVLAGWPGVLTTCFREDWALALVEATRGSWAATWVASSFPPQSSFHVPVDFSVTADDLELCLAPPDWQPRSLLPSPLPQALQMSVPRASVTLLAYGRLGDDLFLIASSPDHAPVMFRASWLRMPDRAGAAVPPTRAARFGQVVETLRQACPAATYDERLNRRMNLIRVLGPGLAPPERHLDLVIHVLTHAMGTPGSPYR